MVAFQQQRWMSFMWTPNIFVAGNSLRLLMLVASLVPCDAFLPPRPRDIASSYSLRIHTPSIFLSNVGRVKTAIAAAATENLEFRSPKLADVDPIADLLVECFETELKWFEFPEKESRRKRYRDMLQKSFLRRIESAQSSSSKSGDTTDEISFMLMVEDTKKKQIVGFVQLGGLPHPPGFLPEETSTTKDRTTTTEAAPEKEEATTWNGIPVTIAQEQQGTADVPYIANLCVLPSCRKSGIGKKMVGVCMRWLDKKFGSDDSVDISNVFLAVESDNFPAKRFWERIDFKWVAPPDDGSKKIAAATRDYYFRPLHSNNDNNDHSIG